MVVTDATCFHYTLPLRAPLTVGGRTLEARRGVLLRLAGEGGAVGWGEAAPLPGFSGESWREAVDALRAQMPSLPGTAVPEQGSPLPNTETDADPPSVRFALRSALLELRADASEETTVPALLGATRDAVPLNALIAGDAGDLTATGARLRRAGYRAVKLKVGRATPERDAARVRALREGLGEGVALRLDANRAWTLEAALTFAEALARPDVVEYVEEPLADPAALAAFTDRTGLPVALDESTREGPPPPRSSGALVGAVVLKPSLLGLTGARRWAHWAERAGVSVVLSGAYESGVGTRMLGALAAAWSEAPAGLSPYTRLAADVLRPRLSLDGPTFEVARAYRSRVESSVLRPIDCS